MLKDLNILRIKNSMYIITMRRKTDWKKLITMKEKS